MQCHLYPLILLCLVLPGCSKEDQSSDQTDSEVLQFPPEHSLGTLLVTDQNELDAYGYDAWETIGEAKGDIAIPANKIVRLDIAGEENLDISPLANLKPNDLTVLFITDTRISDSQLRHLSHLSSLQEINLTETGILCLSRQHRATIRACP